MPYWQPIRICCQIRQQRSRGWSRRGHRVWRWAQLGGKLWIWRRRACGHNGRCLIVCSAKVSGLGIDPTRTYCILSSISITVLDISGRFLFYHRGVVMYPFLFTLSMSILFLFPRLLLSFSVHPGISGSYWWSDGLNNWCRISHRYWGDSHFFFKSSLLSRLYS